MLYVTHIINLAQFVYKVLYDVAPPVENTFFTGQVTPYDMRDNFKLMKPHDFMQFKNLLRSSNVLRTCQCGNCISFKKKKR